MVRGWQPKVIGCIARGTARDLPSTGLFSGRRSSHNGRYRERNQFVAWGLPAPIGPFTQVMCKSNG